jgi:hypothetical protein
MHDLAVQLREFRSPAQQLAGFAGVVDKHGTVTGVADTSPRLGPPEPTMANSSSTAPPWNFRDSIIFIWCCFDNRLRISCPVLKRDECRSEHEEDGHDR